MRAATLQDKADIPATPPPRYRPDWLKKPSGEDLAWAYPEGANRKGIGGKATIQCQVAPDGKLMRCQVVSEDPPGEGFGAAALALAPQFQMTQPPSDAKAPSEITIPLVFSQPKPATTSENTTAAESAPETPSPLGVLAMQGRDWLVHHAKPPPGPWIGGAGLAIAAIVIGVVLSRWSRGADGKDLSGPNSERR